MVFGAATGGFRVGGEWGRTGAAAANAAAADPDRLSVAIPGHAQRHASRVRLRSGGAGGRRIAPATGSGIGEPSPATGSFFSSCHQPLHPAVPEKAGRQCRPQKPENGIPSTLVVAEMRCRRKPPSIAAPDGRYRECGLPSRRRLHRISRRNRLAGCGIRRRVLAAGAFPGQRQVRS